MRTRWSAARAGIIALVVVAFVARGRTAGAQGGAMQGLAADSVLEARTSAVAAQLRCPVCQGLSIQDSPSELAQSMRSLVREQLASGKTPDEVKAYFIGRYGEWILLAPKPSGFNLVAYALPVLAVVCGGIAITVAVRRWTAAPAEKSSDGVL